MEKRNIYKLLYKSQWPLLLINELESFFLVCGLRWVMHRIKYGMVFFLLGLINIIRQGIEYIFRRAVKGELYYKGKEKVDKRTKRCQIRGLRNEIREDERVVEVDDEGNVIQEQEAVIENPSNVQSANQGVLPSDFRFFKGITFVEFMKELRRIANGVNIENYKGKLEKFNDKKDDQDPPWGGGSSFSFVSWKSEE